MKEAFFLIYSLHITIIVFLTLFLILKYIKKKRIKKPGFLTLIIILVLADLIFILKFYRSSPCVDSDGWYDMYTAFRLSKGDYSYFNLHYKYGYGYVFTLSFFFNFLDVKDVLPIFSLISLNLILIFSYLSLLLLTKNRIISSFGSLMIIFHPILLRYTFLFMGKEIFSCFFTTLLIFFFISSFLLKNWEKIFSLLGSIYAIAFLVSIKAEYLFLFLLPAILLFLNWKEIKKCKKSIVIFLILSAIILIPSFFFIRRLYITSIFAMGGNLRMKGKISFEEYIVTNIFHHFLRNFIIAFYYFPLIIFLGIIKIDGKLLVLLSSFLLISFPYILYYPWFFQMRYLVPTIPLILILLIYSLFIFFKNSKLFFPSFICLILSLSFFNFSFFEEFLQSRYCEHQDFDFYRELVEKFGKESIYLTPRTNQEMILLILGADADSFEMLPKYVWENVYFRFYVKGNKTCNKNYPFKLNFKKQVYFIPEEICNTGSIERYLCECLLSAYETECFTFKGKTVCRVMG